MKYILAFLIFMMALAPPITPITLVTMPAFNQCSIFKRVDDKSDTASTISSSAYFNFMSEID